MRPTLLLLTLLASCCAWAGPFGVEMGDKRDDPKFDGFDGEGSWLRRGENPPEPHPYLEHYTVTFSDKYGACTVLGAGSSEEDDRYGLKTKETVDWLAKQISSKYGKPKALTDEALPNSEWAGPENWTKAIAKRERTYEYEWEPKGRPNRVQRIYVAATGYFTFDDKPVGMVGVKFVFANIDACEAEDIARGAEAF
ncbi:MAG: hypothetical protein AAGA68_27015 [Pseudomonadota bacterium]